MVLDYREMGVVGLQKVGGLEWFWITENWEKIRDNCVSKELGGWGGGMSVRGEGVRGVPRRDRRQEGCENVQK